MNLDKISEELFNKLRSRFPKITIGNEAGDVVNVPAQARFFDFKYTNGQSISASLSEEDGLVIMFSDKMVDENTKDSWYDFLKELRIFAKKRMLNFNIRDITKSNLEKRDYKFLAQNRPGETQMTESKLYGTSKISYQDVDNARLVIKHSKPVNQELAAGRTQHIQSIYIESAEGERFKYPYRHLNGARAMARHVSEGGVAYDEFGKHIVGLSEELNKLRQFKTYMNRSSVIAEGLSGYVDIVNERIEQIKKTIFGLQRQNYYLETVENFEQPVFEDVPEDVKMNWIEELTIRQFNEELQDVFPYIYKLIAENSQPEELGPEDLIGEGQDVDENTVRQLLNQFDQDANEMNAYGDVNPETVIRHLEQGDVEEAIQTVMDAYAGPDGEEPGGNFESLLSELEDDFASVVNSENDDFDYRQEYDDDPMDDMMNFESSMNELMGQFGEAENNDVLATLQDIVDNKQAQKVNLDGKSTMVDMFTASAIMQVYNAVNDTNQKKIQDMISSKAGFMKIADFAMSKAGKSESLEEMTDDEKDEFDRGIHAKLGGDPDKFVPFRKRPKDGEHVELKFPQRYEKAMEIVKDTFAKITGIDSNKIDVDLTKGDRTVMIDGETPHPAILSALNGTLDKLDTGEISGMYESDEELPFEPDDKTTDKDEFGNTIKKKNLPKHLAKKGMAKAKEKASLSEFILSYFDRETGQFPKGETAVLTMVEKDYGEEYIEPAKQFIEAVNSKVAEMHGYKEQEDTGELDRIRGLAGL